MNTDDLLKRARAIWGNKHMSHAEIVLALGVVYGDMCRVLRDYSDGKELAEAEFEKELGNMIFSLIRWVDDAGFDLHHCISLAEDSQKAYQKRQS